MWRKFLLVTASTMTLAGTALAADLTPPPPPPIFTWTGLYIGGYGGGEVTHTSYNTLVGPPLSAFSHLTPTDIASVDAAGSQSPIRVASPWAASLDTIGKLECSFSASKPILAV
jgi:opacity protein-like surface antigen